MNNTKNSKKYSSFLQSFGKAILLALICTVVAFFVVFLFWGFAHEFPTVYTYVTGCFFLLAVLALIVWSILLKFRGKTKEERKILSYNLLRGLLIFVEVVVSLMVPFILVLYFHRIFAALVFVAGFTSVGVTVHFVKKK